MDTEVVQAPKFRRPSFIRAVLRLRLGRAGFSVLLTWKVLFFEQDCQTGQDCRARNRFVLRNRSSLPVWLRPSGRAVVEPAENILNRHTVQGLTDCLVQAVLRPRRDPAKLSLELRPQLLDRVVVRAVWRQGQDGRPRTLDRLRHVPREVGWDRSGNQRRFRAFGERYQRCLSPCLDPPSPRKNCLLL